MSHMIEFNEAGEPCIAYAGEVPWHGLGTRVDANLSPREMMAAAKLDWKVRKNLCYVDIKGKRHVTGDAAIVRESDDRILDVVSKDWNLLQNEEAFDFFTDFVKTGEAEMHTAGSIRNGQMVWALAKLKHGFSLFGGKDSVEGYLLFTNPHRYGWSIDVRGTYVRVVCNNTIQAALGEKSKHRVWVNHKKKFNADEVKETLGVAKHRLDQYKEAAEFLASRRYSDEKMREYFGNFFKADSENFKKATSIVEVSPGHEFAPGTWWNAFNAYTFMADHDFGRGEATRLHSAWYGPTSRNKGRALKLATDFARAS